MPYPLLPSQDEGTDTHHHALGRTTHDHLCTDSHTKAFLETIKAMNIESIRDYCLSLPQVTEDFPFDESTLTFRIGGKIFAMMDLECTEWFVLKCDPDYALELRDRHPEISGAWHMNKRYWNQLNIFGTLSDTLVRHLIRHSYNEVVKKMPKKIKDEQHITKIEDEA